MDGPCFSINRLQNTDYTIILVILFGDFKKIICFIERHKWHIKIVLKWFLIEASFILFEMKF